MSYPDYLIHFNKNHSSKNGQFISGDGDGDGVADEHHRYSKNSWAIRNKFQNKDGSLTDKGKASVNAYKEYKSKEKRLDIESKKLLKSNKKLQDLIDLDFDTEGDLLDVAKSMGLDTKKLEKALSDIKPNDVKAVQNGSAMVNRMKDIRI